MHVLRRGGEATRVCPRVPVVTLGMADCERAKHTERRDECWRRHEERRRDRNERIDVCTRTRQRFAREGMCMARATVPSQTAFLPRMRFAHTKDSLCMAMSSPTTSQRDATQPHPTAGVQGLRPLFFRRPPRAFDACCTCFASVQLHSHLRNATDVDAWCISHPREYPILSMANLDRLTPIRRSR